MNPHSIVTEIIAASGNDIDTLATLISRKPATINKWIKEGNIPVTSRSSLRYEIDHRRNHGALSRIAAAYLLSPVSGPVDGIGLLPLDNA